MSVLLMWQGTPQTFEGAARRRRSKAAQQTIARGVTAGVVSIKQLGHQWRRLLRAQLDASVREPDAAVEPRRDLGDLDHPDGDGGDARLHGGPPQARRRHLRHDAGDLSADGRRSPSRRKPAAIRRSRAMGVDQSTGSMEGKEVRFGAGLSALWAVTTTATSNGSVNAMHDSLTPLGGLMPLVGMWLNNIFGGVGVGFINMLIFVIVAVFVAGMMIGRTPEFLGKKVEAREMKLASLALAVASAGDPRGHRRRLLRLGDDRRSRHGARLAEEPRPARLLRDALRVHLRRRQQRLRVRGAGRQHAVLEHLDRAGDAAVAVHPDHRAAGAGGVAGAPSRRRRRRPDRSAPTARRSA